MQVWPHCLQPLDHSILANATGAADDGQHRLLCRHLHGSTALRKAVCDKLESEQSKAQLPFSRYKHKVDLSAARTGPTQTCRYMPPRVAALLWVQWTDFGAPLEERCCQLCRCLRARLAGVPPAGMNRPGGRPCARLYSAGAIPLHSHTVLSGSQQACMHCPPLVTL